MSQTRRAFLTHASTAAALGLLARLPAKGLWAITPADLLPEPDEALMRKVALAAMEAACAAGASFADIRLSVGRGVSVMCGFGHSYESGKQTPPNMMPPNLGFEQRYGIRAIVDGAWGTAGGSEFTVDALAEAARAAVASARRYRPRRPRTIELAPTQRVADGLWATPIEQDPFAVPLGEQADPMLAALAEIAGRPGIDSASIGYGWRRPTTLFASTDGTLIVQRLATAVPGISVTAFDRKDTWTNATVSSDAVRRGPYGYEEVADVPLGAELRLAAERALELSALASRSVPAEIGRYDLVLGPKAVANLISDLFYASSMDAATNFGTFAAPPVDILGKYKVASPLITLHADRTQPGGAATVGWDEEGVKPERYTFVDEGVFIDYQTNRENATELADWYRSRGEPVRAHGLARRSGSTWPGIPVPNLTMDAGTDDTTLDDLIAGTKRGFYLEPASAGSDQQWLNSQGAVGHTSVRQIKNGKLGDYVRDFAFQFITPTFWKSVDGIGGAGAATVEPAVTDMGALQSQTQPFPFSTMRMVPLRVREVNVLNTGRTG